MALIFTIAIIFILLVGCEIWWRRQDIHGEFSRKFIHITVGSFVAFWPYFLSMREIIFLSAAFLIVVLLSKQFKIFQAIHSVQRPTLGEVWFALVVGLLAFTITKDPHVYTIALLMMSLADGFAAVVGTRFGSTSGKYTIFGHTKSVIGSMTFFVIAVSLLAAYALMTPQALPLLAIVPIAIGATALENVAVNGFDNLFVPLSIAGILLII